MRYLILSLFVSLCLITQAFAQISSKADLDRLFSSNPALKEKLLRANTGDYVVTTAYTDADRNMNHVYIQQSYKGINAYNVIQSLVFRQNVLKYNSGSFITDFARKAPSDVPAISAKDAISKVATHLGLTLPSNLSEVSNSFAADKKIVFSQGNIAQENISTELVWVSTDAGKSVHLAWNVSLSPNNSSDYWHVRVDAATGTVLEKGNYTVYENNEIKSNKTYEQSTIKTYHYNVDNSNKAIARLLAAPPTVTTASYNVVPFPNENRFLNGTNVETDPWTKAGAGNSATSYGWHFDGALNYITTRGNNVYAYDDSANKNNPGRPDTSTTPNPSLTFNFTPDFSKQPTTTINRKFNTANLFYWNNLMHDITYQYGFNEVSGNFQNNNINRGGKAGDFVRAEAQDGSGTDNANFSALPDGQTARMQMYLFTAVIKTGTNVTVHSPTGIAGDYNYVEGAFSTADSLSRTGPITANVVLYNDDNTGVNHRACNGAPVNSVTGKIALIFRGGCTFVIKVKNAQIAGAKAVIMVDTIVGGNPIIMGGTDNTITIPAVMLNNADGTTIATQISNGQTVNATINVGTVGPKFDGDIDNSVVTHEYTHGISNRLTGGPNTTSCLGNAEQGGEGWSDYVALMVTTDWSKAKQTDDTVRRAIGSYVISQKPNSLNGVRKYPYSTDMSVDPHVYSDLAVSSEVHDIGEVWCSALWDMTWAIIKQDSIINPNIFNPKGGGGNTKAFQLVMTGLKLQPCSPGFLDARNAILAADTLLYGAAHACTIWNAFAQRGMGLSADQGSAAVCGDELEGYDVPTCTLPLNLIDFTAAGKNNKVQLNWKTAAEVNTKEFTVEYNAGNNNWVSIGTISAKNSLGTNNYSYLHQQPINGENYYRLKMIDKNGDFRYGKSALVKFTSKNGVSIYPNPVREALSAELYNTTAEKLTFKITDMTGRVLKTKSVETQIGNNLIQLPTSQLSKGTYILVIEGKNKEVKTFVKQ